jgi:hypothetical protein
VHNSMDTVSPGAFQILGMLTDLQNWETVQVLSWLERPLFTVLEAVTCMHSEPLVVGGTRDRKASKKFLSLSTACSNELT